MFRLAKATRPVLSLATQPMFSKGFRSLMVPVKPGIKVMRCFSTDSRDNKKDDCFVLMHTLRKDDKFPKDLSRQQMVDLFFPKTTSDMALSLSNVTSAFYGVMLQSTGKVIGMENVDNVSKDFFYNLGRTKTRLTKEAAAGVYDIPKDSRGVVILLVSAIYNASPEYKFNIKHFSEDHCEIELTGVDRYYRITKALGFNDKLQWPVLHRFMEGINDELNAKASVQSEMLSATDTGECHERFTIRKP